MAFKVKNTAILLLSCPDRKGILSEITTFIFENNGNILHSDQHTDYESNTFFLRIEWELDHFAIDPKDLPAAFESISLKFGMSYNLRFSRVMIPIAIFVSKLDHALYDLLLKNASGELRGDIKLIISNHKDAASIADYFNLPFYHVPVSKATKEQSERRQLELLEEAGVELVVLARYMQILSPSFVKAYKDNIINIHHSFLPAFVGAKPYHQAYERGVKIIGATSHYVTVDLDQGPIIEQDVVPISHRDSVEDLIRKGKMLEQVVLSRAVKRHLDHKVLVYGNKTVVFD